MFSLCNCCLIIYYSIIILEILLNIIKLSIYMMPLLLTIFKIIVWVISRKTGLRLTAVTFLNKYTQRNKIKPKTVEFALSKKNCTFLCTGGEWGEASGLIVKHFEFTVVSMCFIYSVHYTYNCVLTTTVPISNTRPASRPTSKPSAMDARQVAIQMSCRRMKIHMQSFQTQTASI